MRWMITFILVAFSVSLHAQSPGDIMFVGLDSDSDTFDIVLLTDITSNSTIKFTDGEGTFTWTTPESILSAGTVAGFQWGNSNNYNVEYGTLNHMSGSFDLANGGDTLFAINNSNDSLAAIANKSGVSGIVGLDNNHLVTLGNKDIWWYHGSTDCNGTLEDCRTMIRTGDWSSADGTDSQSEFYTPPTEFTGTALPVDLAHFTVTARDKTAHLTWATASEVDNDYFLVEKSIDGKSFDAIGKVAGHGTTTREQQYSYEDHELYPMNYYRLKQVDYDGAHEYSKVITLEKSIGEDVHIINRTVRQSLQIDNGIIGQVTYTILDLNGRTLATGTLAPALNDIDVSSVPSGLFIVSIASAGQVISEKIRKL